MLPQLRRGESRGVQLPVLEERLLTALAISACTAAALQSWQCRGGRHPLRLQRTRHSDQASRGELLRWRHNKLAHAHRGLLKVSRLAMQGPRFSIPIISYCGISLCYIIMQQMPL